MLVVLDSSVLVAALRSRQGASFRLLELLRDEQFEIAVSVPLVLEYEAVLVRHAAELNLSREAAVWRCGRRVWRGPPSGHSLPVATEFARSAG